MSMQQIKFRAWFKREKRMVEFDSLGFTNTFECAHPTLFCDNNEHWYSEKDWDGTQPELMQFTGLLDKNGKEIFEGDILKCPRAKQYPINLVVWSDERARFEAKVIGKNEQAAMRHAIQQEWSVIGNLYENPELLNFIFQGV